MAGSSLPSVGAIPHIGMTLIRNEHDLQVAVFEEFDRIALTYPEYEMIYAIPNGQYRPGQRMEPGLKKGYPDIGWDLPRLDRSTGIIYPGLRVELKVKRNKLSDEQVWWAERLKEQGYYVESVWDSVERVLSVFDWYYNLEKVDLRRSVNLQSQQRERNSMSEIAEVFEPIDQPNERSATLADDIFSPGEIGVYPHMIDGNVCMIVKSGFYPGPNPVIRLSPNGGTYPTAAVLRILFEVLEAEGLDDVPTEELEVIFSADCFLNPADEHELKLINALCDHSALIIHFYDENGDYVSTTSLDLAPATTTGLRDTVMPALVSHNAQIKKKDFDFQAAKENMESDFPFN